MVFKIKDLFVNVLPAGNRVECATGDSEDTEPRQVCADPSDTGLRLLYPRTLCAPGASDTGFRLAYQAGCPTCSDAGSDLRALGQVPSAQALATLRDQLKRQLADVERLHAAAVENLRPQTIDEVDMLTGKLNEALEELKVRKAELEKKPKSSGDKKPAGDKK